MILNSEIWSLILLNTYRKSKVVHLEQSKPVVEIGTDINYMETCR
jgi:hypothetical protein